MKSEVNLIEMLKPFLEKSPNEMLMNWWCISTKPSLTRERASNGREFQIGQSRGRRTRAPKLMASHCRNPNLGKGLDASKTVWPMTGCCRLQFKIWWEDVSDPAPGRSTVCECSDTSAKPCSSSSCSKSRSVHGSASLHALGDSDWISKTTKNWSLFHLHSAGQRITSHNGTMIAVSRWWVQCNANKILQWCWIWHSDFRTQTFFHQVDLNGPMVRRHSTSLVS